MTALDAKFVYALNGLVGESQPVDGLLFGLNKISLVVFGLVLVFYLFRNRKLFWLGLFSAALSRGVLTEVVRLLLPRERPIVVLEGIQRMVEQNPAEASFPSGHASFMFAIAFSVWLFDRKIGAILISAAAVLSLIRVYAGVHYVSDVLAGALVAYIAVRLVRFFETKR